MAETVARAPACACARTHTCARTHRRHGARAMRHSTQRYAVMRMLSFLERGAVRGARIYLRQRVLMFSERAKSKG